jgi:hypothetical protein
MLGMVLSFPASATTLTHIRNPTTLLRVASSVAGVIKEGATGHGCAGRGVVAPAGGAGGVGPARGGDALRSTKTPTTMIRAFSVGY